MTLPSAAANSWDSPETRELIRRALEEDIGSGDLTSRACVPECRTAHGRFLAKQDLVVAGTELLPLVYEARTALDAFKMSVELSSGARASSGTLLASVSGQARLLLECEREIGRAHV